MWINVNNTSNKFDVVNFGLQVINCLDLYTFLRITCHKYIVITRYKTFSAVLLPLPLCNTSYFINTTFSEFVLMPVPTVLSFPNVLQRIKFKSTVVKERLFVVLALTFSVLHVVSVLTMSPE